MLPVIRHLSKNGPRLITPLKPLKTEVYGASVAISTFRYCSNHPHELPCSFKTPVSKIISAPVSICIPERKIFTSSVSYKEDKEDAEKEEEVVANDDDNEEPVGDAASRDKGKKGAREEPKGRHLNKDRTKAIPLETSMRYLKSAAYKETYGDTPVWVLYRRNFPGQFVPKRTRRTCIRKGVISTGNPCPICRDEYLVIDYRNIDLLKQFISPYNGEILGYSKTGVCRTQHERLMVAIEKAKDYGLITFDVPFREYDYKEYEKIYESY